MKKTWTQLFILAFVLAGVLGLIYKLKSTPTIENSLGLIFYGGDSRHQVDWCETRVNAIEVPGKFRVFQKGLKWYKEEEKSKTVSELGFVPVEKWFATYCRLPTEGKTEGLATELFGTNQSVLARIRFIDGNHSAFKEIADGIFTWSNVTFRSENMKKALSDLERLPEIGEASPH